MRLVPGCYSAESDSRTVLFQARVEWSGGIVLRGDPTSSMISASPATTSIPLSIKQTVCPNHKLTSPDAGIPINLTRQIKLTACLTDSSCCTTLKQIDLSRASPALHKPLSKETWIAASTVGERKHENQTSCLTGSLIREVCRSISRLCSS
jgi:hypothetical protein